MHVIEWQTCTWWLLHLKGVNFWLRLDQASYSTYYYGLEEQAKMRYHEKLTKIRSVIDPYLLSAIPSIDSHQWPDVQYLDIFNYLIESPSLYTHQQLKA